MRTAHWVVHASVARRDWRLGVHAGQPDLDSAGNVKVALREGDVYALFVKSFFHLSHEVPVDIPVISGEHPRSRDQVDRAVGQFVHANHRCGVIECLGMVAEQFFKDFGGLGDLRGIGDTERQIYAAGILPSDVGDDVVPNLIVGHEHKLVVERQDGGGDKVHRFNLAEHPTRIDNVTNVKRACEQDQDAAGKVAQRALERESDHQTGRTDHGKQRPGIDPHCAGRDHHPDHES